MSSRRSRALVAVGALAITVGVAIGGYIAWQIWGTTWQAHRAQHAEVERLETAWQSGSSTVGTVLRVPRFGRDYAVPVVPGTTADDLARGVGHVDGTANPGQAGNVVLAGHVITHGQPFRHLDDLRPGDRVDLETADGVYHYVVDTEGGALVVDSGEDWVLARRPVDPDDGGVGPSDDPRLLTLITCAELFHTDDRSVVFGHQTGFTPRAQTNTAEGRALPSRGS